LFAGDTRKRTSFYLENSVITIEGSLDSLFKAEVTGSKTHDEYKSYVDSNKPLSDIYAAIYSQYSRQHSRVIPPFLLKLKREQTLFRLKCLKTRRISL